MGSGNERPLWLGKIAFAFLKKGEYLGAGPNHYSVGTYKEDGENLEISVVVTQNGQLRTMLGKKICETIANHIEMQDRERQDRRGQQGEGHEKFRCHAPAHKSGRLRVADSEGWNLSPPVKNRQMTKIYPFSVRTANRVTSSILPVSPASKLSTSGNSKDLPHGGSLLLWSCRVDSPGVKNYE